MALSTVQGILTRIGLGKLSRLDPPAPPNRYERDMTDNGSAYRSTVHVIACRALKIKHIRTKPYRPRTNGKAERFIRTLLAGWAYGAIYRSSAARAAALSGWLDFYNRRRPHGSLGTKRPTERLTARHYVADRPR
jgi:transposase InsO family protein